MTSKKELRQLAEKWEKSSIQNMTRLFQAEERLEAERKKKVVAPSPTKTFHVILSDLQRCIDIEGTHFFASPDGLTIYGNDVDGQQVAVAYFYSYALISCSDSIVKQ